MGNFALGVDIGGTHITAALVDLTNRSIDQTSLARASVNAAGTAEEIIDAWTACIQNSKGDKVVECVCLAMPGPFDYVNGISHIKGQSKYENLYGVNVKDLLSKRLDIHSDLIHMENDAACFLQGEVFAGAARNHSYNTVIGITLGTGLGSAVYKNGKSISADRWCEPFRDSIAEDYLSTRWFVQSWNSMSDQPVKGVKELAAMTDDKKALQLFNEFADNLYSFLFKFINDEQASAVVIGGNISKAFDLFNTRLSTSLAKSFPEIKIEKAILGEEAQLLGAVSSGINQKLSVSR